MEQTMEKKTKIILGVIGGLILLCLCVCIGGRLAFKSAVNFMAVEDPEKVAEMADEMLSYNLPQGYEEKAIMNFVFMKMLMIDKPGDSNAPIIVIAEMMEGVDTNDPLVQVQMQNRMEEMMVGREIQIDSSEEQVMMIAGQETTVINYHGTYPEGQTYNQLMTSFQTSRGFYLLIIAGEVSGWNQTEIEQFLESIR
jgi:hypothetical protein